MIPVDGGEMKQITNSQTNVLEYQLNPDGKSVAFKTQQSNSDRQKELNDRGMDLSFTKRTFAMPSFSSRKLLKV